MADAEREKKLRALWKNQRERALSFMLYTEQQTYRVGLLPPIEDLTPSTEISDLMHEIVTFTAQGPTPMLFRSYQIVCEGLIMERGVW